MPEPEGYKQEEIEALGARYDALIPLFNALISDLRQLSSKKPDGLLNKRKIHTVNRILVDLLVILEREPARPYLEVIEEDDVPQYSDVALLLGQFEAALASFRAGHYYSNYLSGEGGWVAGGYDEDEDDDL